MGLDDSQVGGYMIGFVDVVDVIVIPGLSLCEIGDEGLIEVG